MKLGHLLPSSIIRIDGIARLDDIDGTDGTDLI